MGNYMLFFSSCLVFAFVPGPAMLYTISRTVAEGEAAGFRVVVGVFCGSQVHVIIAATGVASFLLTSPVLFDCLRFAGGGYFLYLGFRKLYQFWAHEFEAGKMACVRPSSFKESSLVEVLNPKSSLFYLAFIPQFLPQEADNPVLMLFVIGTLANLVMSLGDVLIVLISSKIKNHLLGGDNYEKHGRLAVSIVFLVLGWVVIFG
ncbi:MULTISPECIES: LysE family translocator [Halomonadaceae]|jgi:threonine/homoserine/homoserine lactone efflux protein|uniref:LysE family translocator n=1 Tax=Halomonadaceae TaxID=28256 RepID=UPI001581D03B|nr:MULTISPECIES: LysE family translocator [Halomonas]MDI4637429.1 LysE family translocator [Halomonas sp. BMC7]NUJ61263.1 LysE family translocator [Halomonas taeanensis]